MTRFFFLLNVCKINERAALFNVQFTKENSGQYDRYVKFELKHLIVKGVLG